jgi:hypothetical protein
VENRVVGDVAGRDGFALLLDVVHEFGGHARCVLDEFFGIFTADLIYVSWD